MSMARKLARLEERAQEVARKELVAKKVSDHVATVTKFATAGIEVAPIRLIGAGGFCLSCYSKADEADDTNACIVCERAICIGCSRLYSSPDVVRAVKAKKDKKDKEDTSPEKKCRCAESDDDDHDDNDEELGGLCRSCAAPMGTKPFVTKEECTGAILALAAAHAREWLGGPDAKPDVHAYLEFLRAKGIDGKAETAGLFKPEFAETD